MIYEIVEHTADIAIRVRAPSLGVLAARLAYATADLLCAADSVGRVEAVPVVLEAADRETLLVALANEIIYLREAEGLLVPWLTVDSLEETRLSGTLVGEAAEARHQPRAGLKAATYHELSIKESDGGLELFLVFDV